MLVIGGGGFGSLIMIRWYCFLMKITVYKVSFTCQRCLISPLALPGFATSEQHRIVSVLSRYESGRMLRLRTTCLTYFEGEETFVLLSSPVQLTTCVGMCKFRVYPYPYPCADRHVEHGCHILHGHAWNAPCRVPQRSQRSRARMTHRCDPLTGPGAFWPSQVGKPKMSVSASWMHFGWDVGQRFWCPICICIYIYILYMYVSMCNYVYLHLYVSICVYMYL